MAQISRSVATLRIMGDNLIPADITSLLGCDSTYEQTKGQVLIGRISGHKRVARLGMWRLEATDHEPENIDAQISELLDKLTKDISVWGSISDEFEIDLFCGLFMEESNEGMEISPSSLKSLGERGIVLSLDIYDGNDEAPADGDPCPCGSGKNYKECCKVDA